MYFIEPIAKGIRGFMPFQRYYYENERDIATEIRTCLQSSTIYLCFTLLMYKICSYGDISFYKTKCHVKSLRLEHPL